MSNPFDDLESEADDPDRDDGEGTAADSTRAAPVERRSQASRSPAESGPAFEYSSVRQRPLYARGDTWDEFEKTLRTTITPALAREDVVDEETREIHDAVLRLASSEPERVAELVLEARQHSE